MLPEVAINYKVVESKRTAPHVPLLLVTLLHQDAVRPIYLVSDRED